MPAPSLFQMAKRALTKYHRTLDSVGDLPYEMVRFVLIKVDNAQQLHRIEESSPQIIGHDEEIWQALINRDIPKTIRQQWDYKPRDPVDWWKMYRKLKRESDKQASAAAEVIGMAAQGIKESKTNMKVISQAEALRLPGLRKAKRPWGSGPAAPKTKAQIGSELVASMRGGGSRIEKPVARAKMMIQPTHASRNRHLVTKAPARMIEEYQEAANSGKSASRPKSSDAARPTRPSQQSTAGGLSVVEQRQKAEAELRKLESGNRQSPAKRPISNPSASQASITDRPKQQANVFMAPKRRKIA